VSATPGETARTTRSLSRGRNHVNIEDWRKKIDELDRRIVALISERALAAQAIGKLKETDALPIYEPNREKVIFQNVRAANHGPLPDIELTHIYERIIDVMRAMQKNQLASQGAAVVDQASGQQTAPEERGVEAKA
jgi:chorismate mutase